jgi:CRISPR-associated protein Cas2
MRADRLWLISYDIADDRLRLQLEKALLGLGDRVQFSVFECWLDNENAARLLAEFALLLDADTDSVRAYPLCTWCRDRVAWQGRGQRPDDPAFWII